MPFELDNEKFWKSTISWLEEISTSCWQIEVEPIRNSAPKRIYLIIV